VNQSLQFYSPKMGQTYMHKGWIHSEHCYDQNPGSNFNCVHSTVPQAGLICFLLSWLYLCTCVFCILAMCFVTSLIMAMPWLRQLVASLSLQRNEFLPGLVHIGFVVDKVALGQIFLHIPQFSPVSNIPPVLYTHTSSGGLTTGPLVATV
jgi:hypothetical protein